MEKETSSQHDQGGKTESMISAVAANLTKKDVEIILEKLISGAAGGLGQKATRIIFDSIMVAVVSGLAQKGVEAIFDSIRRGNEKTTKALEYKTDETSQELVKTVKSLQECVKELQESRQRESLLLKAYLEKNQGRRNKKKTTKAPESKTDETSQELKKTAKALQECLKELKESRQRECQLRAKLEKYEGKKEEEISSAEMISKFEQLLQRMENVEKHLQKLPESSA